MIEAALRATPWVVPGMLILTVFAAVACLVIAPRIATPRLVVFALVVAVGGPLLITVSPSASLFGATTSASACVIEGARLPALSQMTSLNTTSLNTVLLVPLGALLPWIGSRVHRRGAVAAALLLPFGFEAAQRLLPEFGRSCQIDDVVANLLGLSIGLVLGYAAVRSTARLRADRDEVSDAEGHALR